MARRGTRGLVWAVLAGLAFPGPARAEGEGFKIGEAGRLHVFLDVVGGYDSNALYNLGGSPIGSGVMDFVPGFKLDVAGRTVALRLGGTLDYKWYLSDQASDLSRLFGGAQLGFTVNPDGSVGLKVDDTFSSSPNTTSLSLAQSAVSNYNVLNVAVPVRPGGGALTLTPSGQWILQSFEPYGPSGDACDPLLNPTCTNQDIGAYGYNQLAAALQAKWAFLPKTAVLVEGGWFKRYPNDAQVSYAVQGWRAWGGAAGLVTAHLAATLKGGYGGVFDTPQVTGGTWLLNAEVQYLAQGVVDAKLGYLHDFSADIGQAYALYYYDRVYLDLKWTVDRFVAKLVGSWDYVHYVLNDVTGPILQLTPGLDYEIARWAYVGASYTYTNRSSNETAIPAFNYTRNQVYATLRLIW
jgi:hypothetical protein